MHSDLIDVIGFLRKYDSEIAEAMNLELRRQQRNIELIASENFVSPAVLAAMGSVLTNKYSEGYPGKRYYGGCEYVDIVEEVAIKRSKELFNAEYSNVQAHSGVQANMAAYCSVLKPGDKVLGMSLAHGGHLSHGSPVNVSGMVYDFDFYGVGEDCFIDYEELERKADEFKPKLIVAGASSYPRIIDFERISRIAKSAGAYFMVDMAHISGLIAAGEHPSPIPWADIATTTTHKTLRGPRGGLIVAKDYLGAAIDKAIFPGNQGGPLMHVIAAKAVCFKEASAEDFKKYQHQIVLNSKALAKGLLDRGLNLVSGGTDNHIVLIDLRSLSVTGNQLEKQLDEVYITANKNAIPFDTQNPNVTSGLRLGTPAATTRGFVEEDMDKIADFIYLIAADFDKNKDMVRKEVEKLCSKYPLYE